MNDMVFHVPICVLEVSWTEKGGGKARTWSFDPIDVSQEALIL